MKPMDNVFDIIVLLEEKMGVLYQETMVRSVDRAMRELESYKATLLNEREEEAN